MCQQSQSRYQRAAGSSKLAEQDTTTEGSLNTIDPGVREVVSLSELSTSFQRTESPSAFHPLDLKVIEELDVHFSVKRLSL